MQVEMGPFATKTGAEACRARILTLGQQMAEMGQQPSGYDLSLVVKR